MSNAMRYQSEIQYSVNEVLCRIRDNGGKAPGSLVKAEYARLQGQRAAIVVNVALLAMGRPMAYGNDGVTEDERALLVERAKQQHGLVLHEIKVLREKANA